MISTTLFSVRLLRALMLLEDIAAVKCGMGDKPVYDVVIDTIEVIE